MTIISSDISKAVSLLTSDKLVAIPTETVYGLAGNIYSEVAIKEIFSLKQRPLFNPLIVHTYHVDELSKFVTEIPEKALLLAEAFWPGPLTLVLKKKDIIPDIVTAGKNTVAVRIPDHTVTLELLAQLPFPLAAPSANPFGRISPTSPQHVEDYFDTGLEMVLDGGNCNRGVESTIVGFEDGEPILYRLGSTSMEDIISVVGDIKVKNKKEVAPDAPGMLSRHYAPATKTYLVEDLEGFLAGHTNKNIGVITLDEEIDLPQVKVVRPLSIDKNLQEATAKLYATLHELDKMKLDIIVAKKFADEGLGRTLNDRLTRATK